MVPVAQVIEDAAGVVLAGGLSSRFGSDKATAPWGGRTLLEAVCRSILKVLPRVLVVAKPGQPRPVALARVTLISDLRPLQHPLSGLEAGLSACPAPWAFAVACDMPFAGPGLIRRLAALRDGAQAAAVRRGGRVQPFGAYYARGVRPQVSAFLDRGGSATGLLESLATRWLDEPASAGGPDVAEFLDIDDPESYRRALRAGADDSERAALGG